MITEVRRSGWPCFFWLCILHAECKKKLLLQKSTKCMAECHLQLWVCFPFIHCFPFICWACPKDCQCLGFIRCLTAVFPPCPNYQSFRKYEGDQSFPPAYRNFEKKIFITVHYSHFSAYVGSKQKETLHVTLHLWCCVINGCLWDHKLLLHQGEINSKISLNSYGSIWAK